MKTALVGLVLATTLFAGPALAYGSHHEGYTQGLAVTLGEVLYSIDGDVYRGPLSLELVPSFGGPWLKLDLGLLVTLESIGVADTHAGYRSFTFRPGLRLTPPAIPLYVRAAFPLTFQKDYFDWGLMLGAGVDIRIADAVGLVLEVDTAFTEDLEWGGLALPLEFRGGLSFHTR